MLNSGFRNSCATKASASVRRTSTTSMSSVFDLRRKISQQVKSDPANSTNVSIGTLPFGPARRWNGEMKSDEPTTDPTVLVTNPGPSPRQNVRAAALAVKSTSGGLAPRYGIIIQCTSTMSATVPVEIPISGIKSLLETLALTRRDVRATATDIVHRLSATSREKECIYLPRYMGYKLSRLNPSFFCC